MASLHSALKSLGPCDFSDIPSTPQELETYVSDLFSQSQLILESVPIPPPDESTTRHRSSTTTSVASNASEISSSSARSAPPSPEYATLQKEWGKQVKLSSKENPLNIAVYKLGGKDGHGAWFARRSVHEGLGFAKFKAALEQEFPESMAVHGAPGEGNVRGIGAEKKVVDTTVDGKGRVEVYHLSAQFPGPTTPRDFVTFLVTSSKAMKTPHNSEIPQIDPRHYMVISKPCNHPETQPQEGFIRGQYESVEFIREVPRQSSKTSHTEGSHSLEKEAVLRNAHQRVATFPLHQDNRSADDVSDRTHHHHTLPRSASRDSSPTGRRRGVTVGAPERRKDSEEDGDQEDYDSETNPVEWIMITRSDPGGSVPRFMVERGTPSSIVADASKFFNWACKKEEPQKGKKKHHASPKSEHLGSPTAEPTNGHAMKASEPITTKDVPTENVSTEKDLSAVPPQMPSRPLSTDSTHEAMHHSGLLASAGEMLSSTFGAYAPKAVRDYLPNHTPKHPATPTVAFHVSEHEKAEPIEDDDDASSTISSTSFASADEHLGKGEGNPLMSSDSLAGKDGVDGAHLSHHEKELLKLAEHRKSLDAKLAAAREKMAKDTESQTTKEQENLKKTEEKYERDLKKHEEKHKKEVAKLEQRREKEAKKAEEKRKKLLDKDEKMKLTRERDEARAEIQVLKKESEIWKKEVGELQKANTTLTQKLAKLETAMESSLTEEDKNGGGNGRLRGTTLESVESAGSQRSRSSSVKRKALDGSEASALSV